MNRPTNLNELISYLEINPEVTYARRNEIGEFELINFYTFLRYEKGGLWFSDQIGAIYYIPIACGMTPEETNVRYFPTYFEVTKFNVSLTFNYGHDWRGDGEHT